MSRALPASAQRPPPVRRSRWLAAALLPTLLALHAALATTSLLRKSVTVDEFGHLPVGMALLDTGDASVAPLNPPLMRLLSALPTRAIAPSDAPNPVAPGVRRLAEQTRHPFWRGGYRLMLERGADYRRLFVAARLVSVAVTLVLAVVAWRWAREWAGSTAPDRARWAGPMAAALVTLSPNLLAHGRLVTTDAGAAAAMTAAAWLAWRFADRPSPGRAVALGLALGVAQLVKFTALLLLPVVACQLALAAVTAPPPARRAVLRGGLGAAALALAVLHVGYGFARPLPALGELGLESGRLGTLLGWLPDTARVPLPGDYLEALDRQSLDVERGDPSFLLGESYRGGRADYFVVLLATKLPLPTLGLLAWALVAAVQQGWRRSRDIVVFALGPAALLVAVASFGSEKQIGLRLILPALPLAFVAVAVLAARARPRLARDRALAAACAALGFVCLATHPDYLPYYNVLAGGPAHGHRVAVQSNYDWGQDLVALRERIAEQGGGTVQLLYFGRVDPAIYGIDYTVPRGGRIRPGLLAVSRTLAGRGYALYDHGELVRYPRKLALVSEQIGPPIAHAGHSIRLFRVAPRGQGAAAAAQ